MIHEFHHISHSELMTNDKKETLWIINFNPLNIFRATLIITWITWVLEFRLFSFYPKVTEGFVIGSVSSGTSLSSLFKKDTFLDFSIHDS